MEIKSAFDLLVEIKSAFVNTVASHLGVEVCDLEIISPLCLCRYCTFIAIEPYVLQCVLQGVLQCVLQCVL